MEISRSPAAAGPPAARARHRDESKFPLATGGRSGRLGLVVWCGGGTVGGCWATARRSSAVRAGMRGGWAGAWGAGRFAAVPLPDLRIGGREREPAGSAWAKPARIVAQK